MSTQRPDQRSEEKTGPPLAEPDRLLDVLGLIVSNTERHTWLSGADEREARTECYAMLSRELDRCGDISVLVLPDEMKLNGHPVVPRTPAATYLRDKLALLEARSFVLHTGLTEHEFADLVEVLCARPEELERLGGFAKFIRSCGFGGLEVKELVFREVGQDDLIVSRKKIADAAAASGLGHEGVTTIMAFLKGEASGQSPEVRRRVRQAATDTEKLADMIMQATVTRRHSPGLAQSETLDSVVVGYLRRVFETLVEDPTTRTQKGRKALAKTLMLLDEEMLERLRELKDVEDVTASKVSAALRDMREDLKLDTMAEDYLKRREAIEKSEKQLLRLIKAKGLDGIGDSRLREKLAAGGIGHAAWRELLVRSGAQDGRGRDSATVVSEETLGRLAGLLQRLEALPDPDKKTRPEERVEALRSVLGEVDREVSALVAGTVEKIRSVAEDIRAEEEAADQAQGPEGADRRRAAHQSRQKLLVTLAEIVQELCQPLSVIHCAISMIQSKTLGEVTKAQTEMLELVSKSESKMRSVVDSLMEISGVPTTLSPDAAIQASLYGGP